MARLTPIEHKVLKVLVERNRFITAREVASRAKVSWNTADRYIRRFYQKGWLSRYTSGNRIYWKARI